ncbi:fibropellin-1 isoform X11 [Parasteatoda tepidariorum]|uniref:fibropellin-1 isoform X11 n=1 Tax=Parasteatoda tepidariorum TaxID=114398 RepID=UPI0039BD890D
MNKCVISFLLICVAYVADSLSIDSTFNGDGYECKGTECIGENQKCVPKGNDYYCDCNVNFKLVDEEKKGAKDVQCKDKYECGGTECTGENQRCIPKGNDYFCDCQKDFKLVDETLKGIKDIECRDKYECLGTECTGENQICIPKGNDYFCDCQKDFKLVDEGKKGTKVIQCKDFDTTPGELSTRFNYLTSTPGELPTRFKYLTSTRGELSTRFNYLTSTPGELSTSLKYLTSTPGELSTRFKYLTSTRGEFSTRSKSICDEDRNDCVNGAECLQLGNQRFCHCLKGTYGDKCQHMWDCDERYNLKCNYKNGEICAYNTTLEESECLCVESELQYDTEQGKCKKTCVVGNHDCENGAICKTVGNYGFCECRLGTTGHKCERVTDCDFMNCTNTTGGRCDYDRRLEIAKCVCDNGLKYDEYAYECREICNPQKNDCQNGAMCEKEGNYSFCRCIPRSYGHKCEIVDDCESQKVICNENSGARCGINMDFRGAECLCDNGLKYDEESLTCRETCNFYKNKCENGAHCNRIGAYLFCDCPPGYFGHRCEEVTDKGEYSPLLFILLCITSGFLLISTITLVIIFIKFRSRRNK